MSRKNVIEICDLGKIIFQMKNKRKYEDSTVSAAEVAKKKLKKMTAKKADSPTVVAVKGKVAAFVQDHRKQANNLVDVMAYLGNVTPGDSFFIVLCASRQ